jgi:hypothetical protein
VETLDLAAMGDVVGCTVDFQENRSGVSMEQNVHQNICASQNNNAVLNSINRNQPIHGKNILSTHTGFLVVLYGC